MVADPITKGNNTAIEELVTFSCNKALHLNVHLQLLMYMVLHNKIMYTETVLAYTNVIQNHEDIYFTQVF